MQRILLITGWGGGTRLLSPLQKALIQQGYEVELINIFNALDPLVLSTQAEFAKDFDVILGWSLGGQLAACLVQYIEQHYQQQKILISLGSNPCFVQNEDWSAAMPVGNFQQFQQAFQTDPIATLRKFGFMVCQGAANNKTEFEQFIRLVRPQNIELLQAGLQCLAQLDLVNMLKQYAGAQYHIFAKQDYLVSYKVAAALAECQHVRSKIELVTGSHAFPVFHAVEISQKIADYLSSISDELDRT